MGSKIFSISKFQWAASIELHVHEPLLYSGTNHFPYWREIVTQSNTRPSIITYGYQKCLRAANAPFLLG